MQSTILRRPSLFIVRGLCGRLTPLSITACPSSPSWLSTSMLLLTLLTFLAVIAPSTFTFAATKFFPAESGVVELNPASFPSQVHKEHENTFVLFFSPKSGKCKELQPDWTKLVKAMNGMITVAAVDCLTHESLCESEDVTLDSLPVVKLYNGHTTPRRYGGPPNLKSLSSAAFHSLPSFVQPVTSSAASVSSSSLSRVLLFTDKSDTPNMYKALAQRLRGRLTFGEVKSSTGKGKKLMKEYEVDKVPAVVIEAGGEKVKYDGQLTFPALLAHLEQYAGAATGEAVRAVDELVDASCIDAYCVQGRASLCAVMVLSGSSPTLSSSLGMFESIELSRTDPVYKHVWVDSDKHADWLLQAFGIYPADYPQVLVLSAKKERYVSYLGPLTPDDVDEWLQRITAGKVRTIPYETKNGKLPLLDDGNAEDACTPPPPPEPSTTRTVGPNDRYLHHLTESNFPTAVLDTKAAWMILALDNSHLNTLLPTWLGLVNRTRNAVRVGLVNAEADPSLLKQINVTSLPAVRYVKAGETKTVWRSYSGNMTEDELTNLSLTLLHDRFVKSIKGEEGLIELMSGHVDTPRILLFSKHQQVPPLLQSLSIDYHPDLRFGLASFSDPVLSKKFSIKQPPAFVALAQLETKGPGGQLELVAGSYEQDTKWESLIRWLDEVRANGVVNEGMPEDVKKRYRMGRNKLEADRKEREKEEAKERRRAEAEEAKKREADAEGQADTQADDTASCEVTPGDDGGMCTTPPTPE